MGKLTPGKNPVTLGSAGRSDPARDASGDPGPFTCSFSHLSPLLVFEETVRLVGSQKLAYAPSALATAFRAGLFSFFSAKLGPVWPKPAPDRAGAGRSPTWGVNWAHRRSQGGFGAGVAFPGFPGWSGCCASFLILPKGCKKARSHGTLLGNHARCRRFQACKHQISKCPSAGFCPLALLLFLMPASTRWPDGRTPHSQLDCVWPP